MKKLWIMLSLMFLLIDCRHRDGDSDSKADPSLYTAEKLAEQITEEILHKTGIKIRFEHMAFAPREKSDKDNVIKIRQAVLEAFKRIDHNNLAKANFTLSIIKLSGVPNVLVSAGVEHVKSNNISKHEVYSKSIFHLDMARMDVYSDSARLALQINETVKLELKARAAAEKMKAKLHNPISSTDSSASIDLYRKFYVKDILADIEIETGFKKLNQYLDIANDLMSSQEITHALLSDPDLKAYSFVGEDQRSYSGIETEYPEKDFLILNSSGRLRVSLTQKYEIIKKEILSKIGGN